MTICYWCSVYDGQWWIGAGHLGYPDLMLSECVWIIPGTITE